MCISICESSSQSLKIKGKPERNIRGSCYQLVDSHSSLVARLYGTAWLITCEQKTEMNKRSLLTWWHLKRRSWEWKVDPPKGKDLRKLPGNSSNVCYRRVSTKAKASIVYCFLREPGKQNRNKKAISKDRSQGRKYNDLQSYYLYCPAGCLNW